MGRIGKYVQTPDERKRYMIDYSDWLDSGEAVQSVLFSITPSTTPPLVIDGVQVVTIATGVQYYISGGTNGTNYEAVASMTTSLAQTKEDGIIVSIRDP